MAAAIKKQTQVDPEFIKGKGGIFDVRLNGELIYSKLDTGQFPEEDQIVEEIGKLL